jgi:hypothetical protein
MDPTNGQAQADPQQLLDAEDLVMRLGRLLEAEAKRDEAREQLKLAKAKVKDALAPLQSDEQSATWRRAEYLRALRAVQRGDEP